MHLYLIPPTFLDFLYLYDVISGVDIYRANIRPNTGENSFSVEVKVKNHVSRLKIEGGIGLISNRLTHTMPILKDKLMLIAGEELALVMFVSSFNPEA